MPDTYSQANFAVNNLTGQTAVRTWKERLSDVINVKDFGALGNNVDDTTSIQNAINAAIDNKGGTVYFPVGTYKITSPLVFTHGIPFTGNRLVSLVGEVGNDGVVGNGSMITGSLAGKFIVDGGDIDSMPVSGIVGTFQVGEVVHNVTQAGLDSNNLLTTTSPLTCHQGGGEPFWHVGDSLLGLTSGATATVASSPTIFQQVLYTVRGLQIVNLNSAAGSGALRFCGGVLGSVHNCYFSAMIGVDSTTNAFNKSFHNCNFSCPFGSWPAGSIGISATQNTIINCDFVSGWEVAIQANTGPTCAIINCRVEGCKTAVYATPLCRGLLVSGLQTESIDRCIRLNNSYGAVILNCDLTCNASSPTNGANGAINAILIEGGCEATVVIGTVFGSTCSSEAFKITGGGNEVTWIGCVPSVLFGGGIAWAPNPTGQPTNNIQYINCNQPTDLGTVAFADLPTTHLYDGLIATINNCSTTAWGANADGAGANKVGVRYNGTNWTVFAK